MQIDAVARSAHACLAEIPVEEGISWIAKFHPHSAVSFIGELTHAGYKDVPVAYLVCEDDLTIPAPVQRDGIEMMERESGRKVEVTSIKSGHLPSVSMPEKVVEWILGLVKAD